MVLLSKDKDLWFENKDLRSKDKDKTCNLFLEDKVFPLFYVLLVRV